MYRIALWFEIEADNPHDAMEKFSKKIGDANVVDLQDLVQLSFSFEVEIMDE
jgi:hypothetical protein